MRFLMAREIVPQEPTLPAEIVNFIQVAQQQSSQPAVPTPELQLTPTASSV